jgi:hypothetical protein
MSRVFVCNTAFINLKLASHCVFLSVPQRQGDGWWDHAVMNVFRWGERCKTNMSIPSLPLNVAIFCSHSWLEIFIMTEQQALAFYSQSQRYETILSLKPKALYWISSPVVNVLIWRNEHIDCQVWMLWRCVALNMTIILDDFYGFNFFYMSLLELGPFPSSVVRKELLLICGPWQKGLVSVTLMETPPI